MQSIDQPAQVSVPFADTGIKRPIPVASQIGITDGAASYTDGFPPMTFLPVAAGGKPPAGADFNGLLNEMTLIQQWQSAGGSFKFDATFAAAVGGYPKGARLDNAAGTDQWINTVEDNTTDPDGGTPVGWVSLSSANGVALVGNAVDARLLSDVSVYKFMSSSEIAQAKAGTTALDMSSAMAAARDYLLTFPVLKPKLVFPAGRYTASVWPNWAMDHVQIVAQGAVYLRNTGTGHTVIVDGGAVSGGVFGFTMGQGNRFRVEGGAASKDGVYGRSILQGSYLGFQVNGAGTTYSGMNIEFAVCAVLDIVCSNNVQGFSWYSRPANGLKLNRRGAGELCSYCWIPNPILEGLSSAGALFDWAQGNVVMGGTMEGCASVGLVMTANAIKNRICYTDFEVNTDHDIYCLGRGNDIVGVTSDNRVTLDGAAVNNKLLSGSYSKIFVTLGTLNNLISDVTYNQANDGSTISDLSDGKLRLRDNYNQGLGRMENSPPVSGVSVTVTGSPFTYTNTSVNDVSVSVQGGTITKIEFLRNGVYTDVGSIAGMFTLTSQDALRTTYSAGTPVVTVFSR